MADPKQVKVFDGTNWVDLKADVNLPIKSVDGTVVLSDSSGSFVVSTGNPSAERVVVDKDGRLLVGGNAGDNPNFNNHFRTTGNQQFVIESDTGQPQIKLKADDFWYYFSLSPADDKLRLVSYNGTTSVTYNVFTASPDGTLEIINGINTPSVSGLADNDASVTLGGSFVVSTGNPSQARLTVDDIGHVAINRTPRANTQFEVTSDEASPFTLILDGTATTDYDGRSGLRMYGNNSFVVEYYTNAAEGTYGFSGGSTARSGILGGDYYADILVKPGNAVLMQYGFRSPTISGLTDSDASVTLSGNITINAKAGGTAEELVAVFSSSASQPQRGLQIKNGINGNRSNAHVVLDAKSGGDLGLFTIQTDGNDAFTIGKTNAGQPVDIKAFDGYEPQTDDSLVTKKWVTGVLSGGGGNINGQLPGSGSNFVWQTVQIWQPTAIDGVTQPNLQRYNLILACDGIFTDGLHWTTDGEDWRTSDPRKTTGLFTTSDWPKIVKSYAENLYIQGTYFSYDMKQWNTSSFSGYGLFYFDGHVFSNLGQYYFDSTGPQTDGTTNLYGRSPTLPTGVSTNRTDTFGTAGEPNGNFAFSVTRNFTLGKNTLLLLRADETQNSDWGWNQIDLPNDDEPLNVLYADTPTPSFFVFTGQKVYVSPVDDPTNFQEYSLPVSANWELVCFDGTSVTAASKDSDVSIFSRDGGVTWNRSNNFTNLNQGPDAMVLAGTNGRTIYSRGLSSSSNTDDTGITTDYTVTEYLRSGVGSIGDDILILGSSNVVLTDGVSLTEIVTVVDGNTGRPLPTPPTIRRSVNVRDDSGVTEKLTNQQQTNSYFNRVLQPLLYRVYTTDVDNGGYIHFGADSDASTAICDQNHQQLLMINDSDVRAADSYTSPQADSSLTPRSYVDSEIAKKATVVTLSQAEYDALGADEIDDSTLYLIT